jgi:hypothetical protein
MFCGLARRAAGTMPLGMGSVSKVSLKIWLGATWIEALQNELSGFDPASERSVADFDGFHFATLSK